MVPFYADGHYTPRSDPPIFKSSVLSGGESSCTYVGMLSRENIEQERNFGSPLCTPDKSGPIILSESPRNSIGSDIDSLLGNPNLDLAALTEIGRAHV